MNTPLRRVGIAMLSMIILLLANATYIQVVNADDYRRDPRNQRVLLEEYARQRGRIIAVKDILATAVPTNDRLRYLRQYPNGPMYAPVTGYYSVRYGAAGLERAEDEVLNGSDDRLFVRRLSDLITGRDPRGGSLELTIDPAVQRAAYEAMSARGFTGSVVALRPDTGEILAMVSTPSYDPNRLAAHDSAAQQQAWQEFNGTPDAPNTAEPMLNRAIQQTYPPGSTFKLVVAAAALEDGKDKDHQLTAASNVILPGTRNQLENFAGSHCGPGGNDTVSLETALSLSCNTAFASLAGELGRDKLTEQAGKFGIGMTDLQIPMRVAASGVGSMPDDAAVWQSGIGQRDVRLTPMQDAMVAAAIANGGTLMRPQLIRKILAPDLDTISEFTARTLDRPMSSRNAGVLRDMMVRSEENTRGEGKVAGLTIASKTGTAEHGADPKNIPPHAWYVAFAPADKPTIAVAVLVESGGDRGLAATGGSVAASIGRATIKAGLAGR